jgi:hypothetical protein
MRIRPVMRALTLALLAALVAAAAAAGAPLRGEDEPTPIARGPHISGAVRYQPKPAPGNAAPAASTCSTPGTGNFRTDCNSTGRPVNETSAATNGSLYVAGANDYNSYNGQGQNGYYWSSDGVSWNDAGPIDVFSHSPNNAAGDPGLAIDSSGVVYYSSIFFNFNTCTVGGAELLRRDPATGSWSYYQIAANSSTAFQDKPAIALDEAHSRVFVSWTRFGSCSGVNVPSPIRIAVFPSGSSSVPPSTILSVPGSTYSQGSSIAADGGGGVWVAWEEWPSPTAANGSIKLAHWDGSTWNTPQTISPAGFTDLPSPLPGFAFRTDSFPALALSGGSPAVVWTSYDGGQGRAWLWQGSSATKIADSGGDQFFPSIAADGSGGLYVAYSQVNSGQGTYDQWLWHAGASAKVSTASSDPSQDTFFAGTFIGDYNGLVVGGGNAHPIWTDIRGPDPNYSGWEMDAMFSAAASPDFSLSASPPSQTVTQGGITTYSVTITPSGGFSSSVDLSVAGLPSGATGTFSPNPATSSSTLTVDTGTAAAGTYPLTISGTGGGVTHTTSVTLVIQSAQAGDFSLSATPPSRTVKHGGSATYTVTITPSGGFTGAVQLSVGGLPYKATGTFSPNPATSSSTLTVKTNGQTPAGTSTLTITGTSGSLVHQTSVTLVVT